LPAIVLAELRNRTHDKDARSRQARQILARIRRFPARRILHVDVSGIDVRRFLSPFSTETRNDHCDNRILAAAKRLLIEKKPATLLSDDTALRKRAIESGITAVSLREFFADTVFPAKNKR
jgi:predicted ribonuclease YlaK